MKKLIIALTALVAVSVSFYGVSDAGEKKKETPASSAKKEAKDTQKKDKKMREVAVIETKHGNIVIKFFDEVAPKHVESFKKLAKSGFYDGTTFHRVIPGFMIQGGDPNSKDAANRGRHGMGGPGYNVPAEFSKIHHKRGIVSAARANDPDSAGSQFFICVADSSWLDGQYSVFGEVLEGMDAADKIVHEKKDSRDNPLDRIEVKIRIEERPAE